MILCLCHALIACSDCLLNIVLYYCNCLHFTCPTWNDAALLLSALYPVQLLYVFLSPVLILHVVCFIVVLMANLTSGQQLLYNITLLANTGTFTVMLINAHCP